MKKQSLKNKENDPKKKSTDPAQTKVKSNTGIRPKKDTNPLPPNPNEVDNHDTT